MFKVLVSKTIAEFIQFQIPMGIFSTFLIRSIVSSWRFKSQWEKLKYTRNKFQIPTGVPNIHVFTPCNLFQIPMGKFSVRQKKHLFFGCSCLFQIPTGTFCIFSNVKQYSRCFKSQWGAFSTNVELNRQRQILSF